MTGQLFIVATPIGNLKDITFRAVETLENVDLILAEDTRKTGILLKHYEISTEMLSYRDQNHKRVYPKILNLLKSGKEIALVSDSGTPLISDPGYKLVKELREEEIEIFSIPGPSAVTAALSISGIPTDKFIFLGFLPKGMNKRKTLLKNYGNSEATIILYESPYRILKLLQEINDSLGKRRIFIANEVTKKFEKHFYGYPEKLIKELSNSNFKGELTVLISKND